jgi:hypothetical protein
LAIADAINLGVPGVVHPIRQALAGVAVPMAEPRSVVMGLEKTVDPQLLAARSPRPSVTGPLRTGHLVLRLPTFARSGCGTSHVRSADPKEVERRGAGRGQGPAVAAVPTSGGQRVGDCPGAGGIVKEVAVQAQPRQRLLE